MRWKCAGKRPKCFDIWSFDASGGVRGACLALRHPARVAPPSRAPPRWSPWPRVHPRKMLIRIFEVINLGGMKVGSAAPLPHFIRNKIVLSTRLSVSSVPFYLQIVCKTMRRMYKGRIFDVQRSIITRKKKDFASIFSRESTPLKIVHGYKYSYAKDARVAYAKICRRSGYFSKFIHQM